MRLAYTLSICFALAAAVAPTDAFGADPSTSERALRLSEEAAEFYKAHDYRHAVEKYATAFELDPDPNLLYNQGKCYEALGDFPAARDKYNEFLSKPNGDVNARKKASEYVAKFNAGAYNGAPGAPAAPPAGGPVAAGVSAPAEGGPEGPSNGGAFLRPLGYGLAAAGLLGAAAGGYFFLKGSSNINDVKDAPGYGQSSNSGAVAPLTEAEALKKIDDGDRQRTLGGILLGTGAGLAALGVVFVIVAPKSVPASTAALNVSPLPGGGYATFGARF